MGARASSDGSAVPLHAVFGVGVVPGVVGAFGVGGGGPDGSPPNSPAKTSGPPPPYHYMPFLVSGLYQASLGPSGLAVAGQMFLPASWGENHFCIFTV